MHTLTNHQSVMILPSRKCQCRAFWAVCLSFNEPQQPLLDAISWVTGEWTAGVLCYLTAYPCHPKGAGHGNCLAALRPGSISDTKISEISRRIVDADETLKQINVSLNRWRDGFALENNNKAHSQVCLLLCIHLGITGNLSLYNTDSWHVFLLHIGSTVFIVEPFKSWNILHLSFLLSEIWNNKLHNKVHTY